MSDQQQQRFEYPDIGWYSKKSMLSGIPVRCPYANVHSCPRHYQSLSLLGDSGIVTAIALPTNQALKRKWMDSPLWPVVDELATTICNRNNFKNFCPEVIFDIFGLFASSLGSYSDEIDRDAAEAAIITDGNMNSKDWRLNWSYITALHYSECPLYPQLAHTSQPKKIEKKEEIVSAKLGAFGVTVDAKQLLTRFAKWWLGLTR